MKKSAISFLLLFFIFFASAQQNHQMVFESGKEGHNTYRIPAIIQTTSQRLLAFCEGRVDGGGDFGNIDIVMKYSDDNGKTWSALKTIVDMDSLQAGNPAPVVDLTDVAYPAGRIFLFYNTGNNHENEVRKGNGLREVWYTTSTDNGITWTEPVNITTQVHRPNQPQVNAAYHFAEDWRSYANTPGHAVQFDKGKHKGRIFVAANHSTGNPQPKFADYNAHGFYTDDHGKTFKLSTSVNIPGSNESTAALLGNGVLIMNSRNQQGDIKRRIVSYSSNGGASWDTSYFDYSLPDPVNEGSILTIKNNTIAFCNAADTAKRDNLTLRISKDGGKKWSKAYTVDKSAAGYKDDFTAYADLVKISGTSIGVLYERDDYKEIVFKVVAIR
ncbi:MAG: exo-alpha-sialidase [Chitinophagaceae bacterium]|nr:exo-alpha-sialidase [Chitinophagaceae bacterium]